MIKLRNIAKHYRAKTADVFDSTYAQSRCLRVHAANGLACLKFRKLIPSFVVGKRDSYHTRTFMEDLAARLSRRVQLSSDAHAAYPDAVERGFGSEIDYGQLVKTYSLCNLNKEAAARYSPCEVVKVEKTVINARA